jgi:hypothetical protein
MVLWVAVFRLCAADPGSSGEGPALPPLVTDGAPNPQYAQQLQESVKSLTDAERKPFFKRLRKQQREVKARIEEMTFTLGQAQDLKSAFKREGSSLVIRTEELITAQRTAIAAYKAMNKTIAQQRRMGDPQRLDADPFKVDFYAGVQFSSLYKDPNQETSFFAKSRPFVALDMRQTFRWPENEQWVEIFGTLSFQSSSKEKSDTVDVITTSGNFRGETGLWYMRPLTENVSWGVMASVGLLGYSMQNTDADLITSSRDEFRNRSHLGFTLRQEEGAVKGSFAEIGYVRDPQFVSRNRFLFRGRVVLTQFGSQGSSGDFYMEGFVSKGRTGRDEAVLLLGLRLSTISFFRSLGSGSHN